MYLTKTEIIENIWQLTNDHFLETIFHEVDQKNELVSEICEIIKKHNCEIKEQLSKDPQDAKSIYKKYKHLKIAIGELIGHHHLEIDQHQNHNELDTFLYEVNGFCATIPYTIKEIQREERFKRLENDKLKYIIGKWIKRIFYGLSQWPIHFLNLFRKLFRKKKLPPKKWHRKVALRNLITYYFRDQFGNRLLPIAVASKKAISNMMLEIWKAEEKINKEFVAHNGQFSELSFDDQKIHHINKNIDSFKVALRKKVKSILDEIELDYDAKYEKIGTLELSNGKFSLAKNAQRKDKLKQHFDKINKSWVQTHFALFDNWRMNNELYYLSYIASENFLLINNYCQDKIDSNVIPLIEKLQKFLINSEKKFSDQNIDGDKLALLIINEIDHIESELERKIIPEAIEKIVDQKLPDQIGRMENLISKHLLNSTHKRAVVSTTTYDRAIRTSELEYFSPNELISFEILPAFLEQTKKIKKNIVEELEEVQNTINEIVQICLFNLESAKSIINQKNEKAEPITVAREGIARAVMKAMDISKNLESIETHLESQLGETIKGLHKELISLTSSDKILLIRIRIAKAKAISKSKLYRETIKAFALKWYNTSHTWIMSKHAFVLFHYQNLLKKYGLIAHAAPISSELSDFLGETDQSIEKLPFIYQRLFKIASLKDRDFFEGHENEILNLGNAYNNWQKGRYAPTFIVGEKGSGKSTLINLFLADLERTYTNQRFNCTTKIYDIPSFLSFFKEIFNHNGFESAEDIINHIQDSRIKQLIIIEDIHHLFIKKVNGFICLKMLFEIISKTNHQIFWLLSATRYSWSYLNKTLDIEDYFGYIINVQELEDEQIIELILKRHRVSGYNLFFQPSQLAKASKQYRKLPDHEKQPYLKNYYFTSLNKFAKDNISLALLFWLRSAKDVKDDTIYIGDLDNLDFTFLSSLSQEKIFVLYALILHDGLTISQLSDIQNKSYDQCKLIIILLWDDGIISTRDSFYIVNPLLYRHVISLLKSKNLLN